MAGELKYEGFVPGRHSIDGYGSGGFEFAGMSHRGSILALPSGIHAFAPTSFAEIDDSSLAPLFALPRGAVELILFGCGPALQPVPPALRMKLREAGISCDPMDTGAACQTYNILLGERRLVGAALIATL
ncbi:Mth938-like domain-containing protein [Rhodoblastus acidophilus]|uniref:Mth938-like domain-containing protein n=1 Tax=Candidatus Rhodoblastus alkanivorans TaxID=2954117 RepID=A0ABS9Z7R0_9HYPH|nr:Mth938-like domain-containing protein [Candidatus Rhodoblastus alkanivorans]MCI4679590.1 Mth938-like domain-containing protein [Candidatus Rhodoblastus alkanivorans]MCI4683415.1 Mth938-like domain-containing protein [Candidatus Rhodoblastus alkanivorans]MDI4640725.1 Mth938-like domain-containing protein [Rhodoblastus acidophilus]